MALLVRNGTVFDGTGRPRQEVDILIEDGRVVRLEPDIEATADCQVIEADSCWVTPGFIDLHTHYDAELEIAPGLTESVRHGVTTVLIGSCGLSMVAGEPEDMADMFCRVEGIPRDTVLPVLEDVVDWSGPAGYVEHLSGLQLGPNLVAMAGHSTIRAEAMGFERSVTEKLGPTEPEFARMEALTEEAIEAGMLGLSANLLPWDKLGGTRFRSRPTPSVFATFGEYRRLAEVVRRRRAVFQAIPNLQTRWSIPALMDLSRPRDGVPLRTSLLSLMDAPPAMGAHKLVARAADAMNRRMGAELKFQSLPTPFDLYTDGLENPVFEELGAGTAALHIEDLAERRSLMASPEYRKRFRRQWTNKLAPRAYHRDLDEARIVSCPDHTLDGMTFAHIARERGEHPVETFLDLQAEFGNDLRWYSVVANGDPDELRWIVEHPAALIGFSDAGAHLRNMAFYNFGLRMLKRTADDLASGRGTMSVERSVHRLTAEIADFLKIDAGRLEVGSRADLVVIDPAHLDADVERIEEAEMAGFNGLRRLVRRNDKAVRSVVIKGCEAWSDGAPAPGFGVKSGWGEFLPIKADLN